MAFLPFLDLIIFIAILSRIVTEYDMVVDGAYSNILFISDQHYPYAHRDIVPFLRAIKEVLKPELVINLGDEIDFHDVSFHKSNRDLPSAGDELKLAIEQISQLYELFPEMLVCESNHGSLVYRRVKDAGIPVHVLKSYRDVLGAPKGWSWHEDLLITTKSGDKILACHGKGSNALRESQLNSMNYVAGHYHSQFGINYWANSEKLYWSMQAGCLVDQKSLAYEYAKNFSKKFIIGTGVLINNQPRLLPMVLDHKGRWIKKLV